MSVAVALLTPLVWLLAPVLKDMRIGERGPARDNGLRYRFLANDVEKGIVLTSK